MKKIFYGAIWILFIAHQTHTFAQSSFLPLQNIEYHTLDRIEIKSAQLNDYIHTSAKPYTRLAAVMAAETADDALEAGFKTLDRFNQYYVYQNSSEWSDYGLIPSKKPILKHFYKYRSDLLHFQDYDDFMLKVSPVLRFELATEQNTKGLRYVNTRGLELRGMISEKIGFYAQLTENQSSYPNYAQNTVNANNAVPGEGRFKDFSSTVGDSLFARGSDYFGARGYVTFQPIERVRLTFGHDKNFIGNGVRSLILSDYSNSYLFLRLQTQVWKLHYQNLFMELTDQFSQGNDSLLTKKYAAIHHLSFNVNKWLNVGVSETVTFGRSNGFELQYLNPIIFYRAIEYHLGSPDNVMLAADWKANFLRRFSFYGQFVLDEFNFGEIKNNTGWWANKYGYQLGLKYMDVAGISNLDWQIEYNSVQPYTYTHNTTVGNFTHYNQPLAHPLGANFSEVLNVVQYRFKRNALLKLNLMYAQKGLDNDTTNWGGNIFLLNTTHPQDYNNKLLQGIKANTLLADLSFSYMYKHGLWFDVSYTYRKQTSSNTTFVPQTTNYIGGGVRLNINRKELLF